MKTKIAIVMYRGLVQAVYSDNRDIEINVVEIDDKLHIEDASLAMDATESELGYQVY